MFSTTDTIVAIATPPGRGGIGVVRLSGPAASAIAATLTTLTSPLEPRRATFTTIHGDDLTDHVIATLFSAPRSYTGEDVVELSAHGSPVVLRGIVTAAVAAGARLAEPGEFTLRAYLNGRLDLPQAEAVADLIDAVTPLQARAAFDQLDGTLTREIAAIDAALFDVIARLEASVDFPEEGYHFVEPGALAEAIDGIVARTAGLLATARRGRLVREGLRVVIVGPPNVGKSRLFNALVGSARAIVTDLPGTTRDLVTEVVDLDGVRVTLVDTAGLRDTDDRVEAEGVVRSRGAAGTADLVVVVADGSSSGGEADLDEVVVNQAADSKTVVVLNKQDIGTAWNRPDALNISAETGFGLEALRRRMLQLFDAEPYGARRDQPALTNVRHVELVRRAHESLLRARAAALSEGRSLPEEFVLADLQDARAAFEEVTGKRSADDVLAHIFATFCIGK